MKTQREGDATAVDPVVATALATLGIDVQSVESLGGWRAGRTTYRVTAADGRMLKARRVQGHHRAARAADLAAALDQPDIPPPIAVLDRVTIEAWVAGTVLRDTSPELAHLDAAAALLARLHTVRSVSGRRFQRQLSADRLIAAVDRWLHRLEAAGVVRARERRQLAHLVRDRLPAHAMRGVCHGDFCPENLVVTRAGALVSIDNEALHIGFLDLDLARTWCRWPMSDRAWAAFLLRYGAGDRAAPEPPIEHAWRVAAAVRGAHRWQRARRTNDDVPLAVLRRVLDESRQW